VVAMVTRTVLVMTSATGSDESLLYSLNDKCTRFADKMEYDRRARIHAVMYLYHLSPGRVMHGGDLTASPTASLCRERRTLIRQFDGEDLLHAFKQNDSTNIIVNASSFRSVIVNALCASLDSVCVWCPDWDATFDGAMTKPRSACTRCEAVR
jgi:hypothetical protein